ncbi:MAG: Rieske (2Fe-2S) domain protein, partial [Chloroflexi bacterium]|nr:Rieske (2Fe-2S) domain protein [Chloroflexota bacterium]
LPRYDVLQDLPIRRVGQVVQLDCNWLQFVEQNVDQAHVLILHQNTGQIQDVATKATTRGNIDDLVSVEYSEAPFGIKRRQVRRNGYEDTDIVLFPATLRIYNQLSVKVPIDDTHTRQYHMAVDLGQSGAPTTHSFKGPNGEIEFTTELASDAKTTPDAVHPFATYQMDKLRFQDFMALETQGPIAARESEHLATSDRGIMLLRTILMREIEKVQQGLDPIGVIRDPDHAPLSTYVENYLEMVRRFPAPSR